jgi:hypothetical protein
MPIWKIALRNAFVVWTPRRFASRDEFWIVAPVVLVRNWIALRAFEHVRVLSGTLAIFFGLVIIKELIWRYRDIGRSPWWLVLQYALLIIGFISLAFVAEAIFVQIFGAQVNDGHLRALAVVGLLALLPTTVWMFVWTMLPTWPRDADGQRVGRRPHTQRRGTRYFEPRT